MLRNQIFKMEIAKHTVATVTYSLRVDGELVEETGKEKPLTFLAGVGMMIPGFEGQLMGKKIGDNYDIKVSPGDGYGDIDENAIVSLSIDIFKVNGEVQKEMLQVGKTVPMQDQQGNPLQGTIVSVDDENVKMDFNHQLAGKTLHFTGEIMNVREATKEEIDHGHVHGPGGHHH